MLTLTQSQVLKTTIEVSRPIQTLTQIQLLIAINTNFKTYANFDIDPSSDIINTSFKTYVNFDIDPSTDINNTNFKTYTNFDIDPSICVNVEINLSRQQ